MFPVSNDERERDARSRSGAGSSRTSHVAVVGVSHRRADSASTRARTLDQSASALSTSRRVERSTAASLRCINSIRSSSYGQPEHRSHSTATDLLANEACARRTCSTCSCRDHGFDRGAGLSELALAEPHGRRSDAKLAECGRHLIGSPSSSNSSGTGRSAASEVVSPIAAAASCLFTRWAWLSPRSRCRYRPSCDALAGRKPAEPAARGTRPYSGAPRGCPPPAIGWTPPIRWAGDDRGRIAVRELLPPSGGRRCRRWSSASISSAARAVCNGTHAVG